MTHDFLVDTYETERLKTLGVWAQFRDGDLSFRPEPRARTPLEHMVHQCVSEDGWMTKMLAITVDRPVLPATEGREAFIGHYAEVSRQRLAKLRAVTDAWFAEGTLFFGEPRSRAWVLVRRIAHSAHHRGQLTVYLRLLGRSLYSTYGPTADTGGLPANGAIVRYPGRASTIDASPPAGWEWPHLPGPGGAPPTERPQAPAPEGGVPPR